MDKKAREVLGLPVITMNRGTKIYDVEDMILDPERSQVLALVVQESSWMHSARAVPFGRINVIGRDAVVIPDGKAVIEVNRDPVLRRLDRGQTVRGLRVLTDDGRKLGAVDDMLLDSKTGEVKGYYVTLGRGLTVGQGSRWLPAEQITSIGQRVLFVPASVADDFEQQSGGISSALDSAGGSLRTAGARLNTQLEQFGTQLRQTVPQRATGMLVGKTAHQAVNDRTGNAIANPGEVITQEHVDRAREAGKLPQLVMAAGAGPARQGANSLGNEAQYSLSTIPNEARSLWNQLSGNYSRTVDEADSRMMQHRIKRALGRPVTRVILDGNDNVILNTGDIVTNRAVDAARQSGVLDILVDSIYTERPKLGLEDLKAPHGGYANLDNSEGHTSPTPASAPASAPASIPAPVAVPSDNAPAPVESDTLPQPAGQVAPDNTLNPARGAAPAPEI